MTGDSFISDLTLRKDSVRTYCEFTLPETAYSARFQTATTQGASAGFTGIVKDIQVEEADSPTDYIKPLIAVDGIARESNIKTRNLTINTYNLLAGSFNSRLTYSVGERVVYNDRLYEFINYHPSGDWDVTDVIEVTQTDNRIASPITPFESTRNLWKNGNVYMNNHGSNNGFTAIKLKTELQPGTYTISGIAESDCTEITWISFRLYSDDLATSSLTHPLTDVLRITKSSQRTSVTFTISSVAHSAVVLTTGSQSASSGYTGSFVDIQLEEGDVATDYVNFLSAVDSVARNEIGSIYEHENDVGLFNTFKSGYIDTSGDVCDFTSIISHEYVYYSVLPCEPDDSFIFECMGGNAERVQFAFCDSNGTILLKASPNTELNTNYIENDPNNIVVAPKNSSVLVVHHCKLRTAYSPKVFKLSKDPLVNKTSRILPKIQKPDWKRYVIAICDSLIAILYNGRIRLSRDCGHTWNAGIDVSAISDIRRAYLFENGSLNIFTSTSVFYTLDWINYYESTCYEKDGVTRFSPETNENFFTSWTYRERERK